MHAAGIVLNCPVRGSNSSPARRRGGATRRRYRHDAAPAVPTIHVFADPLDPALERLAHPGELIWGWSEAELGALRRSTFAAAHSTVPFSVSAERLDAMAAGVRTKRPVGSAEGFWTDYPLAVGQCQQAWTVSDPTSRYLTASFRDRELDLSRVLHYLGGVHDLEPDDTSVVAKVGDDSRTDLVAFLYSLITKRDDERIGLLIVGHPHGVGPLRYFSMCDVLYSVTTTISCPVSSTTIRNSISCPNSISK